MQKSTLPQRSTKIVETPKRKNEAPKRKNEARECYDLMQWCRSLGDTIPQLKPPRIYHIANEGKRTPRYGSKLRAMGLCKGVPDYFWMFPYGSCHGIYIEMKTSNTDPTTEQVAFMLEATEQKYLYILARGWKDAARMMLLHLMNGKAILTAVYNEQYEKLKICA